MLLVLHAKLLLEYYNQVTHAIVHQDIIMMDQEDVPFAIHCAQIAIVV